MVIMGKFLSLCTISLVKCKLRALQIILVLSLRGAEGDVAISSLAIYKVTL